MGQGGSRIKCRCGSLSTTKIILTGKPLLSGGEVTNQENIIKQTPAIVEESTTDQVSTTNQASIDMGEIMALFCEISNIMIIPNLKAIAQHTGCDGWDGRYTRENLAKYTGFMCDSCTDIVLGNIPETRWNIGIKMGEFCHGGLP